MAFVLVLYLKKSRQIILLIFIFRNNKSGESNLTRLRQRVLDVLYFWVEGFYSVDFDDNSDLIDTLQNFLEEAVSYTLKID